MTRLTHLNTSLKIDSFSDPDKVARDLTVKTLSKNLLRKYGLTKEADEEGETTGESTGTGSGTGGAKLKGGRQAMTKDKKELIKSGSIIALGCQGVL